MQIFFEIIGYLGMAFVLSSFLMKNIMWLRILNIVGAVLCSTYGFVTYTYPTAILNLLLIIINVAMIITDVVKNKKAKKEGNRE